MFSEYQKYDFANKEKNEPPRIFRRLIALFLFIAVAIVSPLPSVAQSLTFKDQMQAEISLKYRHWNTESKKVTGFNEIISKLESRRNEKYIFIENKYYHSDGEIFLEKKTWFDALKSRLVRHEEKDFRNGLSLVDVVKGKTVKTEVSDKEDADRFEAEVEPGLVLLETIIPTLRKNIPRMIKKQPFEFTLYIPLIAFDLKNKYFLPFNIIRLDMTAVADGFPTLDSAIGKISAVRITVQPDSDFIKNMLPDDRKEFKFIFDANPPHLLLIFEEYQTQAILTEIERPGEEPKALNIQPL